MLKPGRNRQSRSSRNHRRRMYTPLGTTLFLNRPTEKPIGSSIMRTRNPAKAVDGTAPRTRNHSHGILTARRILARPCPPANQFHVVSRRRNNQQVSADHDRDRGRDDGRGCGCAATPSSASGLLSKDGDSHDAAQRGSQSPTGCSNPSHVHPNDGGRDNKDRSSSEWCNRWSLAVAQEQRLPVMNRCS